MYDLGNNEENYAGYIAISQRVTLRPFQTKFIYTIIETHEIQWKQQCNNPYFIQCHAL
jgi:hypothetical protein